MPLSVGDKLGHYEVLSLLGQGGMGEVYRARDTTLRREVALKVLPAVFLRDPERMARFQREAEVLASLDHPNVGHIYGIVDSEDSRGLVLALIEGPTLADRIEAGPLPQEEAIAVAKQIIEALEYAHDRGVVHRDLKPANIKITSEGVVKVLDFGLAKVLEDDPPPSTLANSPTLTVGHTRAGVILGTAAYMSPEQAVGRRVDRRSDIFSFGAVLYEMLTGKRAFGGSTTPDVFEAVVKSDPDWAALPTATPPYLRRLLERMLEKDRKQRLQAIGEARIALEHPSSLQPDRPVPSGRSSGAVWALVGVSLVLGAALAAVAFFHFREQPPSLVRLEFPPPEKGTLIQSADQPAVSPDGRRVAFAAVVDGRRMLWVRDLDASAARMLPGTEDAAAPFWAPDSRQIAYFSLSASRLMKIDVAGGPAIPIVVTAVGLRSGTWNQDNVILFGQDGAGANLFRVSAGGGTIMPETELDPSRKEIGQRWPHFLPDGRHFLYTSVSSETGKTAILAGALESKEKKLVALAASNAQYVPPSGARAGHILFVREGTLLAQPFDADKLETAGEAVPIAEHVELRASTTSAYFGASRNGILVYASDSSSDGLQITWYDRTGKVVGTVGKPVDIEVPRLSPNGKMLATDRLGPQSNNRDIWLYDLVRGSEQRLTFAGNNMLPTWSPDGLRVAYSTWRDSVTRSDGKIVVRAADGTGQEEVLEVADKAISAWTRDGAYLLTATSTFTPKTGNDIWALPLAGPNARKPMVLRQTEFNENWAQVSPDGKWLAYQSDESKRLEVYVVGFPALNGRWQISTNGGRLPLWSRDGRELYFVGLDNKLMAIEIQPGAQFQAGLPKPLFDVRLGPTNAAYEVSADGRFLIATPVEQSAGVPMKVVLNWQAVLRK